MIGRREIDGLDDDERTGRRSVYDDEVTESKPISSATDDWAAGGPVSPGDSAVEAERLAGPALAEAVEALTALTASLARSDDGEAIGRRLQIAEAAAALSWAGQEEAASRLVYEASGVGAQELGLDGLAAMAALEATRRGVPGTRLDELVEALSLARGYRGTEEAMRRMTADGAAWREAAEAWSVEMAAIRPRLHWLSFAAAAFQSWPSARRTESGRALEALLIAQRTAPEACAPIGVIPVAVAGRMKRPMRRAGRIEVELPLWCARVRDAARSMRMEVDRLRDWRRRVEAEFSGTGGTRGPGTVLRIARLALGAPLMTTGMIAEATGRKERMGRRAAAELAKRGFLEDVEPSRRMRLWRMRL